MRLSESTEEKCKERRGGKNSSTEEWSIPTLRVLGKSGETSVRDQERKKGLEK